MRFDLLSWPKKLAFLVSNRIIPGGTRSLSHMSYCHEFPVMNHDIEMKFPQYLLPPPMSNPMLPW